MKKIISVTSILFVLFLVSVKQSNASPWIPPQGLGTEFLEAGDCILVNTVAEKDANHVYTLNPDNTRAINQSYVMRWSRNARCDEIQFHVDHNTPISVLNNWLDNVAYGWYANLGSTHFKGQTVSTSRHEWFYVDQNGILQRIPDWLTSLSWGLLVSDRLSVSPYHADKFYEFVTIGPPLGFNDGQYAVIINNIWKNGSTDYTGLPPRLADEFSRPTYLTCSDYFCGIFEACDASCFKHDNSNDNSCCLRG